MLRILFWWCVICVGLGFGIPLLMMQFEKPGDATGDFVMLTVPLGLLVGCVGGLVHGFISLFWGRYKKS